MLLYTFLAYRSIYELYTSILSAVIYVAIGLSVLVSLDRIWHVLKCGMVVSKAKLTGKEPEDPFRPGRLPDPEFEAHLFPRVAIQLPMFNERAVCQAIIDSACEMHWPHDRSLIQVVILQTQLQALLRQACQGPSHNVSQQLCMSTGLYLPARAQGRTYQHVASEDLQHAGQTTITQEVYSIAAHARAHCCAGAG